MQCTSRIRFSPHSATRARGIGAGRAKGSLRPECLQKLSAPKRRVGMCFGEVLGARHKIGRGLRRITSIGRIS
jgi:hypothetical protein